VALNCQSSGGQQLLPGTRDNNFERIIDKRVLLLSLTWLAHRPKFIAVCFVAPHSPLTSPFSPALVHTTQYLCILLIKYERKTKG
jgi:hypothetical protein